MKFLALIFAALAMMLSGASAQVAAAIGPRNVKIERILPSFVTSPEFQFKGTEKRATYLKWFEIELEFGIEGVEIVDELTLRYDVLMGGKLYFGEVTHVNIPKGKDRYSVMYISPRNLDRMTGGKPITASSIDNIWVTVSKQGQTLTTSSWKDKTKPVPNLPQLPGMLSPKSDTPFQVLWWDRYEAVKPGAR